MPRQITAKKAGQLRQTEKQIKAKTA